MKKVFFILTLATGLAVTTQAQINTAKLKSSVKSAATTANTVATASGIDVKSVSSNIMAKLTSSLNLTDAQKPKVLATVTSFLQNKSAISGLLKTDKTQYDSKLTSLKSELVTKLKGALTAEQMTKFLNLKPAKTSTTDALSQLFN